MRTTAQRKSDALGKLRSDQDVWVATADRGGIAHLVPLSLCWHDGVVVVAVEASSRTARNASASGQARLALGPTRDVVMREHQAASGARRSKLADPTVHNPPPGGKPRSSTSGWSSFAGPSSRSTFPQITGRSRRWPTPSPGRRD
jgi:Pyridoxamine 5'-phosphate oxidase